MPVKVLDEEVDQIINMGVETRYNTEIKSMKSLLDENFDAIFVGTGAPKGRDLFIQGREEAKMEDRLLRKARRRRRRGEWF